MCVVLGDGSLQGEWRPGKDPRSPISHQERGGALPASSAFAGRQCCICTLSWYFGLGHRHRHPHNRFIFNRRGNVLGGSMDAYAFDGHDATVCCRWCLALRPLVAAAELARPIRGVAGNVVGRLWRLVSVNTGCWAPGSPGHYNPTLHKSLLFWQLLWTEITTAYTVRTSFGGSRQCYLAPQTLSYKSVFGIPSFFMPKAPWNCLHLLLRTSLRCCAPTADCICICKILGQPGACERDTNLTSDQIGMFPQ